MYLQFNKKNGKNGKTYHSVLLCEKYRKDGVIKTKVVMNLSKLPSEMITALKTATNKTKGILIDSEDVKINYTIDYGYIFIILQFIERLRIRETLNKVHGPKTNLILLMIVGKLITQPNLQFLSHNTLVLEILQNKSVHLWYNGFFYIVRFMF